MEKLGDFKFRVYQIEGIDGWNYQILDHEESVLRDSKEIYKFQGIARFAAIGHIALIEQKKE